MLRKYRHNGGDTPKDPDIEHWFHALGSPPVAHEPLGARARFLARIERPRRFAWLPMASPALAMGLAAALLLSIGLNVWWGRHLLGPGLQGTAQMAGIDAATTAASPLSTYHFQAQMQQATELGTVVAARPVDAAPMPVVGFTPEAVPATAFVRLGSGYADTLAALASDQTEAAASRLDVLVQTLEAVQAPSSLSQYLSHMRHLLTQHTYDGRTLTQFVALFEPLYAQVYTQAPMANEVILFRAGAWLENLSLAATVGNKEALQQSGRAQSLSTALRQFNLPPNVLGALEQLDDLLSQPTVTDRDMSTIRAVVEKIQQGLSA